MTLLQTSEQNLWQAILDRDDRFDGKIFYGVHSTHIYCRPSCPSRRPQRHHVSFFRSPLEAEAAGFRPCKRCHPKTAIDPTQEKMLTVCRYLQSHSNPMPTLAELGSQVSMSPGHLQRVFKQQMGITPFQYAEALRTDRFKQALQQGEPIAQALYDAGYGSASRLYEKAAAQLGMTPATYQRSGQGMIIRYTITNTSLGALLVAATDRGLCSVRLGDPVKLQSELQQEFFQATLQPADTELQNWVEAIVEYLSGTNSLPDLPCDVQATAFQLQVWDALRRIPAGTTVHYSQLAEAIAQPTAVRAVARACATNPIALVVPCHRVVPKAGGVGGYRWGVDRKEALLRLEQQFKQKREEI
ncbi:MAG TPA: bifunctional DNA-binding transcriptional regulator/O6-methylguanine-DNA methyltransferase Ada [Trichocoleus sp.]